ncbi:hypothetical protein BZG01_18525 [Labilibaculum manganireducens]|uniref:Uncharacterized protein n=1 Tax=Labilibaculum manganireducens TaxID=1940525 RepID=A0A2N3HV63_9BACT|nr:hypothetical protein BZG01_18525 [Labilibaculum manganireducens]
MGEAPKNIPEALNLVDTTPNLMGEAPKNIPEALNLVAEAPKNIPEVLNLVAEAPFLMAKHVNWYSVHLIS